jgi:outer membrane biosynthesis protein TonB
LAILTLSLALAGCSRDFPAEWNSTSPASSDATVMPHAHVTHALDGDPPLPGEASEGWIGLEQPVKADSHAPHHGHGEQPVSEPEPEPSESVTAPTKLEPKPKSKSKPKPKPEPEPEPAPTPDDHAHHQPAMPEGHHHGH